MKTTIANGVWPTVVTPFTQDNEVDYVSALKLRNGPGGCRMANIKDIAVLSAIS